MTNPANSIKTGKRSYKSKYSSETVHLFNESGFAALISDLNQNGIKNIIGPEKHLNDGDTKSIKSMSYIGKKIA